MKLAEDLKKAVLQAAMQGKLTKQLETDSSVDELLKKNVISVSEDSDVIDIPESWKYVKLGNLVSLPIKRGKAPKYVTKSSVLVFAQKCNQKYGPISMEKALYLNEALLKRYNEEDFVKANDIVINSTGGGTMGRVGFVEPTVVDIPEKIVPDTHVTLVRANTNIILERYLYTFCKSMQPTMESLGVGSTNQTELRPEIISNLNVPLPPIEEQQRIVEKLNQVLPLIDEYGKEEDELIALCQKFPEEMKKSVLQTAMQGKLTQQLETDSSVDGLLKKIADEKEKLIEEGKIKKEKPLAEITEDEIPFDIPENWRWTKLGLIGDWGAGATPDRGKAEYYKNGTIPWIKTGELNDGIVTSAEEYITELAFEKCSLRMNKKDDVLIAMYGATIGKVAIAGFDLTTNQACCACTPYNGIFNYYLFYFLKANKPDFVKQSAGGAQPNISRTKIVDTLFPLPPIEEQKRIVEKLNTILPIIDSMAVYGTKKKAGRPKQEEALAFISLLLGTNKSTDSKPVNPEITELKAKAKEELPAIIKKYAELMDVTYNRITIRHQKTRWGSCTKTGNLSFNCLLMKMPENVRDYVIIHELAHRKELNHSTKFWTIVAEYCPWYKDSKQWLKDNGQELMEK